MTAVEFILPVLPLSKNKLRMRRARGNKIPRTPEYEAWRINAGKEIMIQRVRGIKGPYILLIKASRNDRGQHDLGNILEATEDLLQWMRVIENDRLSEDIHLQWSSDVTAGVVIRVEQWKGAR